MITDKEIKKAANEKFGNGKFLTEKEEGFRKGAEWALEQVKNRSIPDVSARTEMRKQAITVFELTKGFTGEPTDNAMKTALEMADYVMRLTNDL